MPGDPEHRKTGTSKDETASHGASVRYHTSRGDRAGAIFTLGAAVWPSEQRWRQTMHILRSLSSQEYLDVNGFHHAVVWIDHSGAKVFRFSGQEETEVDVHSHTSLQRLHHRSTGWEAGGNQPENTEFYQRIMGALDSTGAIVITGPGYEKVKFQAFLDHFRPRVAARVCALETLEHPAAEALLALGRRYFHGQAATGEAPPAPIDR